MERDLAAVLPEILVLAHSILIWGVGEYVVVDFLGHEGAG
jgi:hypothetical protein